MNQETLDVFVNAVYEIFEEIGIPDLTDRTAETADGYEVIATVGFTGDLHGYLSIRATLACADAFIDRLLDNMGMEKEEQQFGPFHKEALGEIVNQITARSSMLLEERSIACEITPPTILIGSAISFNVVSLAHYIDKEFAGSFGSFNLFVGITGED
jgi:CheY-specific phosphatase CheX